MQHAEGISANTEFEYLRNIMFQVLSIDFIYIFTEPFIIIVLVFNQ